MSCWGCKYMLVYYYDESGNVYCAVHGEIRYRDNCSDYRGFSERDDERDKILEFIDYLLRIRFKYCASEDTYDSELCSELENAVRTLHHVRSLLYDVKNKELEWCSKVNQC